MPDTPDNKMDDLLKSYARKRKDEAGAPAELHPATRRLLQGEVAKLRPQGGAVSSEKRSWFTSFLFSPRFVGAAAVLLVLGVTYRVFIYQQTPESPAPVRLAGDLNGKSGESASLAARKPASALDDLTENDKPVVVAEQFKRSDSFTVTVADTKKEAEVGQLGRGARESEVLLGQKREEKSLTAPASQPTDGLSLAYNGEPANRPADLRQLQDEASRRWGYIENTQRTPPPPLEPAPFNSVKLALGDREMKDQTQGTTPLPSSEVTSLSKDAASLAMKLDRARPLEVSADRPVLVTNAVTTAGTPLEVVSRLKASADTDKSGVTPLQSPTLAVADALSAPPATAIPAPPIVPLPGQSPAAPVASGPVVGTQSGAAGYAASGGASPGVQNEFRSFYRLNALAEQNSSTSNQRYRQVAPPAIPRPAARPTQAANGVLSTFEFQQEGGRARVIDADGSVYEGIVSNSAVIAGSFGVNDQNQRGLGRTQTADQQSQQPQFGASSPQQNANSFRLTGTNRTLRQQVVFEGNFIPSIVSNEALSVAGPAGRAQAANEPGKANISGFQNQNAAAAQQIQGTLRVGPSDAVPVQAVPIER